jgi:hypothetical protein
VAALKELGFDLNLSIPCGLATRLPYSHSHESGNPETKELDSCFHRNDSLSHFGFDTLRSLLYESSLRPQGSSFKELGETFVICILMGQLKLHVKHSLKINTIKAASTE